MPLIVVRLQNRDPFGAPIRRRCRVGERVFTVRDRGPQVVFSGFVMFFSCWPKNIEKQALIDTLMRAPPLDPAASNNAFTARKCMN